MYLGSVWIWLIYWMRPTFPSLATSSKSSALGPLEDFARPPSFAEIGKCGVVSSGDTEHHKQRPTWHTAALTKVSNEARQRFTSAVGCGLLSLCNRSGSFIC